MPFSVRLSAYLHRGFHPELYNQVGTLLGQEAKDKDVQVLLAPTICCHRSPLGGRNFESFSEEPWLSGTLASSMVNGVQSQGVSATVKHFVANEQETRRFNVDAQVAAQALHEVYLISLSKW
ncbi:hypothetical protein YB2330_003003 [Saitoella coloradoensis]